ncbi:hypothetical protein EDD68_12918 [Melghiribacillus thermohalophilus]|uniref:Uncharacterized protein n=1 Tax=Melghiribacillus thermohalophilus TaxID=1324956 RepID=A0A4R3MUB4_9BACI|nr:hypothetical protein EDD68_12918 [Melghiribacillus thermohalophilus]
MKRFCIFVVVNGGSSEDYKASAIKFEEWGRVRANE